MDQPATQSSFSPRDPEWERRCRESFARQHYMRFIGGALTALAPGRCSVEVALKPELTQQRGFLHGGVTAALADTAAGFAAYSLMPAGSSPLTVEFKINLMAPAVGERFVAAGQVVRGGRLLSIVDTEVFAVSGGRSKPIAKMLATLICMEGTPDRAAD